MIKSLGIKRGWIWVVMCLVLVSWVTAGVATGSVRADDGESWRDSDLVKIFTDEEGREVITITVPGRPPEIKAEAVAIPASNIAAGTNSLSNVPAFDWCYGCSATSAAMMMGYYDINSHPNMYAGPANCGVCPLDNSTAWAAGVCPLSATDMGYDGLAVKGHVEDFWSSYGSSIDPCYSGCGPPPVQNWTPHTYADCTGDYMGTNQYCDWNNTDGSTQFTYWGGGSPCYDYPDQTGPNARDGCHGMKLFVESRGYSVAANGNYNQFIAYSIYGNGATGFTFAQYKSEIDNGRPVLIQVEGHTMLGIGYNDPSTVYLHDTWDHSSHSMTWGGDYQGNPSYTHYGVTVLQLESAPPGGGDDEIGVWRGSNRYFYLDVNDNGIYNGSATERFGPFLSSTDSTDRPVAGNWDDDGTDEAGVWRGLTRYFYLDVDGDGIYDGSATERFGPFLSSTDSTDRPVAGDWNGGGGDEAGVWRGTNRYFYLDVNDNGIYDGSATERFGPFLSSTDATDRPVAGDWDGNGNDQIGIWRGSNRYFYLDVNGNGIYDGSATERFGPFLSSTDASDVPVAGNWDGL